MSHFKTTIPVHLDRIKALLPPGSTFDRIEWNPQTETLEMFWLNGGYVTKYTHPWDWPIEQLESREMPEGIVTFEEQRVISEILAKNSHLPRKLVIHGERKELGALTPVPEPPVESIIKNVVAGLSSPNPTQSTPLVLTESPKEAKSESDVRVRTDQTVAKRVPRKGSKTSVDTAARSTKTALARNRPATTGGVPAERNGAEVASVNAGSALP